MPTANNWCRQNMQELRALSKEDLGDSMILPEQPAQLV